MGAIGGHYQDDVALLGTWPEARAVADDLPEQARRFLSQALASLNAPDGAVMLAASAVDAMLKAKALTKGTLNERIEQAVSERLITEDMGHWAHEVRLDANQPRHADETGEPHTIESARRAVEFVVALGDILFVLPARVQRGRRQSRGVELVSGSPV